MLPQTIETPTEANVVKPKIIQRATAQHKRERKKRKKVHRITNNFGVECNKQHAHLRPCSDQAIKIKSENPLYFVRKWHIYPELLVDK